MKSPRQPIKTPEQEARALAQREANRRAAEMGLPLPYPSVWDALDPTKIDPKEATPEAFERSCREFRKLCRPRKRIRHSL
jgi:hypothetical protein